MASSHEKIDKEISVEDESWAEFDRQRQQTYLDVKTKREIMTLAAKVWRTSFATNCYPISRSVHECKTNECEFDQIIIQYMLGDHDAKTDIKKIIHLCISVKRSGWEVTSEKIDDDDIVVNTKTRCAGEYPVHKGTEIHDAEHLIKTRGKIDYIYACIRTGLLHVCTNELCNFKTDFEQTGGDCVCKLTGCVLSERESVDDFWLPREVKARSGNSWNANDNGTRIGHAAPCSYKPFMSNEDEDTIGEFMMKDDMSNRSNTIMNPKTINNQIKQRKRRRMTQKNPYKQYLVTAYMRISTLFSRTRYNLDNQASRNDQKIGNVEVYRQIKSAEKDDSIKDDAISLWETQIHSMRSRPSRYNLVLSRTDRNHFLASYARKTLQLWTIIRTRTNRGLNYPNDFPFAEFVIAAMYIFRTGLFLPPQITLDECGEQLLEKDSLLDLCLPMYDMIDRLDCDRSSVTKVKKAIVQAITDAVKVDRVPLEKLRPQSIDPENVDHHIYRNIRKTKKKKTR